MENSIFHRLSGVLWTIIVTLIVLLAMYVSIGRMLTSNLSAFQGQILEEINSRVPFTVEARTVGGEWISFTPVIVLNDLRLSVEGSDQPPLELTAGRVGVDVLNSLRTRSLQLTRLVLDDLSLRGELTPDGKLRIQGFDGDRKIGAWFREFILNIELVGLRGNHMQLTLPGGEVRGLDMDLRLTRDGSYRRVEATLVSSRGTRISALAEGVGNPFTPNEFAGELYLDVKTDDLGAIKDMLAEPPRLAWAEGIVDLEVWFAWDHGQPSLEARAEARNLHVADPGGAWSVPLDSVALAARLVERKKRWTLFASDLKIVKQGVVVALPRLQLDAWGRALRVRTAEVPLEPLNTITSGVQGLPPLLADLTRGLQPDGMLSALQLSIGDVQSAAGDWEVSANFEDIAIESWKGAPGLTSASGYLEFDPQGGYVLLDSREMTMAFPKVYAEPLHYDEFAGTIHVDWDESAVRLSSDLVEARGAEGLANALFGLNIPLQKKGVGLEMDLLVGLQNAHPTHRVKYVPDVLNQGLRDWLNSSIGEGQVDQGAFLWRGTLARETPELRTIQLAFNVSNTSLDYHPRWPGVTVIDGIVLVDDTNVSVWSGRARLFDSEVRDLSVETWLDGNRQIMLAVAGQVRGPAADGLEVINHSPISDIVAGAFSDWTVAGGLDIDLDLELNISDPASPPRVDVGTRWHDVDMTIRPGNLPVKSVSGAFTYSSDNGFTSRDLQGRLWGKPLQADIRQLPAGDATGAVEVSVSARADLADVRQWLDLDPLALAQGEAAVDIRVLAARGEPPLLSLESDLVGVGLDLPTPWRKPPEEKQRLQVALPLAGEGSVLELGLGEDVTLHLDVLGGTFRGGAMAVGDTPAKLEPGVLRVGGSAPLVQGDDWVRFISQYFYTGNEEGEPPPESGGRQLAIEIDQLRADELVIWGQTVSDVVFSLDIEEGRWHLQAGTDWLRGEYFRPAGEGVSRLDIEYFDMAGLDGLSLADEGEGEGEQEVLELPDVDVTIARLDDGEREVGQLRFGLRSEAELLKVINITGELAGMELPEAHPGRLHWRQGAQGESALKARFAFGDIGEVLGYFGYEKILETKKGRFDFDLSWPGSPREFSIAQARGSTLVNLEEGNFLEVSSGTTGALRVVNILNLAEIVRRLSLSHMFESGIPFDRVQGEVFLHSGVIEVAGMDVEGPSSFHFNGISNVEDKSLNGELVATFPVANNLPWVAALTASLPIAAGVYLVSKVFQNQVDRLSSAVYSISGSWDDPEVNFDRMFDDTVHRVAAGEAAATADDELAIAPDPQEMVIAPDPQDILVAPDPQAVNIGGGPPDPQAMTIGVEPPIPQAPDISPGIAAQSSPP